MAKLDYGDVSFTFAGTHTQSLDIQPVFSPDGLDYECSKVTFEILGAAHPAWLASNKVDVDGITMFTAGDRLPTSMFNLRDYMLHPQRLLRYQVANRIPLESPIELTNGTRLTCDVRGGPFPEDFRYTKIIGDNTGIVYFRVHTFMTHVPRFLLSLRWNQTSSVDEFGYTSVTTRGRASFRKDWMVAPGMAGGDMMPDDFRGLFVPLQSFDLRRASVDVVQDECGRECDFTVVDREVTYGVGASSKCAEIVGTVTGGVNTPIKDLKTAVETGFGILWDLVPFFGSKSRLASTLWNSAIPRQVNVAQVRVIGRKDADQVVLANIARDVCVDRFKPIFTSNAVSIASAFLSVNVDSDHPPYAEYRIEFLGLGIKAFEKAFTDKNPAAAMNLSRDYKVPNNFGIHGPTVSTHRGPQRGTVGTHVGRMVAQALMEAAELQVLPGQVTAGLGAVPAQHPGYERRRNFGAFG